MAAPGCGQGPEPGGCLMGALSVPTAPRMAGGERAKSGGFGWQGAVWGAIAVAVCAGVAFAAGVFGGGGAHPLSLYQRTMAVAGEYRCPVCAGESVAASDVPEAVEIKGLVQQWLAEGRSQAQIRSYLVKDYGTSILETPPTSGVSVLVWALPGAAVAAGLIGLGFGFARWRRAGLAPAGPAPAGPAPAGPVPDGLADPDAGEVAVAQQQVLFAARARRCAGPVRPPRGGSSVLGGPDEEVAPEVAGAGEPGGGVGPSSPGRRFVAGGPLGHAPAAWRHHHGGTGRHQCRAPAGLGARHH